MTKAKQSPSEKSADRGTPIGEQIAELYALIKDIDIAMLTTQLDDGSLVSRPMSTQTQRDDVDLWFMSRTDTHKLEEIERHPDVNLGYYKDREWVSVTGTATVTQDRSLIHQLYQPDWKIWLEDNGGAENGGPDDPRIALINVRVDRVTYFKRTQSRPVVLFELAKALITGSAPKLGEERHLEGNVLHDNTSR